MRDGLVTSTLPLLQAVETGLLALLVLLGVMVVGIFIWRSLAISLAAGRPEAWLEKVAGDLTGEMTALSKSGVEGEQSVRSVPGRMVNTGIKNAHLCPEALEKLLEAQELRERKTLETGVSFLGTVGSNAPFIGLTGTVIGILVAFQQMAGSGGRGGPEVMSAISGALIATAAGLIVAIPAVVFYNILKARIKATLESAREIRILLVARSLQATVREEF